jgi:hypothetical protein
MNQREYWAIWLVSFFFFFLLHGNDVGDILVLAGGILPAALKKIGTLM